MIRCGVQAGLEAKWEREVVEDSEKVEDQGIAYYFKHFKYITQHGATEDEILGVSSCHQRSNNFFFLQFVLSTVLGNSFILFHGGVSGFKTFQGYVSFEASLWENIVQCLKC